MIHKYLTKRCTLFLEHLRWESCSEKSSKKTCERLAGRLIPKSLIKIVTEEIEKHRKSILVNGGGGSDIIKETKHNNTDS